MKATIEIPDELYRRVKARSALEGRPLRAVAIELFQQWLEPETKSVTVPATKRNRAERKPTRFDNGPWLTITQRYLKPGMSHDMDDIRAAITRGWGEEVAEKLELPKTKP